MSTIVVDGTDSRDRRAFGRDRRGEHGVAPFLTALI